MIYGDSGESETLRSYELDARPMRDLVPICIMHLHSSMRSKFTHAPEVMSEWLNRPRNEHRRVATKLAHTRSVVLIHAEGSLAVFRTCGFANCATLSGCIRNHERFRDGVSLCEDTDPHNRLQYE